MWVLLNTYIIFDILCPLGIWKILELLFFVSAVFLWSIDLVKVIIKLRIQYVTEQDNKEDINLLKH